MNKFKHILSLLVFVLGFNMVAFASYVPNPNKRVPLDGGVSALIVAGVAYGAKKYRDYRMSKKEEQQQNSK